MNLVRFAAIAFLALAAAAGAATAGAEGSSLRVDILVFAQPAADGANYWQDNRTLPPCHAVALHEGAGAEAAFTDNSGCERKAGHDPAYPGFAAAGNATLTPQAGKLKTGGYPLLLNRGWRQASLGQSPVLLRGGRTAGARQELEGTITIGGTDKTPEVTLDLTLTRMDGEQPQYVALKETRRVKSGEPHYFDHPMLGAIVQITVNDTAP